MCACVSAKSLQSCPTLCDSMDCRLPGLSVRGILQARILECVAMPSSRESFQPRIQPASLLSPTLSGGFFTISATWEAQLLSHFWLFETPWTAARQASLSLTNSQSLLKLMSIESMIQPSHPLSSPSPSAFNLSQRQGLFQWVSSSHQVAKVLELQL